MHCRPGRTRLYVKHRLLTAEWTKSISCRWERPISYLIRRMLIDISLLISPLQPLRLDIKRKLTARSDRVKSVDLHPTEPWMVVSLYSGTLVVWNHESQVTISPFHIPLTHTHTHMRAVASYLIHPSFFFWSSVMLISPFGLLCVQTMVKTFELCDLPVRVAKFVARKHWVIAGAVSVWTQ